MRRQLQEIARQLRKLHEAREPQDSRVGGRRPEPLIQPRGDIEGINQKFICVFQVHGVEMGIGQIFLPLHKLWIRYLVSSVVGLGLAVFCSFVNICLGMLSFLLGNCWTSLPGGTLHVGLVVPLTDSLIFISRCQ